METRATQSLGDDSVRRRARLECIEPPHLVLVDGDDELTKLLVKPGMDLLTELERLQVVTLMAAQAFARGRMHETPVKDIGSFGNAVASTILRLSTAARMRAQALAALPTPDGHSVTGTMIEHDDLDQAWAAMRKLQAEAA